MIRLIQRKLIIPRGDTGSFSIPYLTNAAAHDIAVFTIFDCLTRSKIFQKTVAVEGDALVVTLLHTDTVNLKPGKYVWDIKFYTNPQYLENELINGDEVDSYYAGYTLPECEIRETSDNYLMADDAPTSTLSPEQLEIVTSALARADADAAAAMEAANLITGMTATAVTLPYGDDATASYSEGVLTIGVPLAQDAPQIDDSQASSENPWSGEKIAAELATKANSADLTAVATSGDYSDLSNTPYIPTKTSDLTNDSNYPVDANYIHTDNNYTTAEKEKLGGIAAGAEVNVNADWNAVSGDAAILNKPTNVSDFTNDAGYLTEHQDISGKADKSEIPTKVSELQNDSGYLTSFTETDPTVPEWAKAAQKPSYTAAEVGALPSDTHIPSTTAELTNDAGFITSAALPTKVSELENDSGYLTAHQDISGKLDSSLKGAANGLAELDENGKVPTTQLPAYVDDVLEYAGIANFPASGDGGKIYVDTTTNLTYRWGGSQYVEISASLALGETSSTAYRGDRGAAAYTHAVTNKGAAYASGLYKITTNSEGHVTDATAVTKSDITDLGLAAADVLAAVATSGAYSDLTGTPTNVSAFTNDAGYLTAHQDISGKANTADLATVATSGSYNDLSDKPTIPTVPVQDVQINSTSILSSGTANIPLAGIGDAGVVKVALNNGTQMVNGILTTVNASVAEIKTGTASYKQINPGTTDSATFYGLAKAAGDSTQAASANAVGTYTNAAKAAIKNMLGITQTLTVIVVTQDSVTVTGQTVTVRANGASGEVFATAAYEGQPVSFSLPSGFSYYVSVSDTLAHHFNPTTAHGIITNTDVSVTLQYSDFHTIRTAADIKAALNADIDLTDLVGESITCTRNNETLTWDVVDYDSTNGRIMLLLHDAFGTANMVFEPAQALMWCEEGLAAGNYMFTVGTTIYYFTLTQAIPAEGQLVASDAGTFATYASQSATLAIETGTVSTTVIADAIDLGTAATGLLNHNSRVRYGSNNYAESALLWWLNTDAAAGTLRTPVTKFSRAYSYNVPGFLYNLDSDFIACLDDVDWPCSTNNVYECPQSLGGYTTGTRQAYTVTKKIGLASEMEIFGSYGGNADGSTVFDLYNGADADDRKKYRNTTVQTWWLRSPYWGYAYDERYVSSSGTASIYHADYSYAVVPAVQISKDLAT